MPRQMSEKNEWEFAELKAFLHFYNTHVRGISEDNPIHPSLVLEQIITKFGRSKALSGLRQAINDTIEETQRYNSNQVAALDQSCTENGVITLSDLRRRYWRKYKTIVEKRRIRNDTEYYLVVGILSDLSSTANKEERQLLQEFVDAYENK